MISSFMIWQDVQDLVEEELMRSQQLLPPNPAGAAARDVGPRTRVGRLEVADLQIVGHVLTVEPAHDGEALHNE